MFTTRPSGERNSSAMSAAGSAAGAIGAALCARDVMTGPTGASARSRFRGHAIIEALEARDTELAEKRARDHTLGLAAYVEAHGQELFT